MKKVLFLILLVISVVFLFKNNKKTEVTKNDSKTSPTSALSETKNTRVVPSNIEGYKMLDTKYSLFFPYWTLLDQPTDPSPPIIERLNNKPPDNYIYFGITPDKTGINKSEPGFSNMEKFSRLYADIPKRTLTLRMTNTDTNLTILEDDDLQNRIVDETLLIAKRNGFNAILFDLELAALPTDKTTNNVTSFIKKAAESAKTSGLQFSMTLFGDTFYRSRPFDVAALDPLVDQFVIMAYDFHKSKGSPGPNFPLGGAPTYGYDFATMIDDFLSVTKPEKLTIAFGLYGYDWTVDGENRPLKPATALTLAQIKKKYLPNCPKTNCNVLRDNTSTESSITYSEDDKKHVIWFEDEQSVGEKIKYLETKGIFSISFWGYGYY